MTMSMSRCRCGAFPARRSPSARRTPRARSTRSAPRRSKPACRRNSCRPPRQPRPRARNSSPPRSRACGSPSSRATSSARVTKSATTPSARSPSPTAMDRSTAWPQATCSCCNAYSAGRRRSCAISRLRARALGFAAAVLAVGVATAQDARTPAGTVDSFHKALAIGNAAGVLALLARELVVYEYGLVDPTIEAYAFKHRPLDMDYAAQTEWALESRRAGGGGEWYWVLSTYRVTGADKAGQAIDQSTLETVLLRRMGDSFRIVHFHWSSIPSAT
ncbi:MAG: hypothetical protein EXQ88_07685 [Alphaproteobacteria bacterium]|nr:hypothetical protein [Alphaproteobacteria bacterium]